ncbi:MAG: VOC family protein [Chloroflexi bacterium]|nr:VOC family protein [Chloroflexota bacterium]MDA1173059.1 VOC family protein [Chloroflexota bacterium]
MGIVRMDHIELLARDLEQTITFYVDVLGFKRGRRTISARPDGTRVEQACVILDDFMIELFQASPEAIEAGWDPSLLGVKTFALRVEDMAATKATLEAQGVVFSREPSIGSSYEGLRAEILDPSGISIELREWLKGDSYHVAGWKPSKDSVTLVS